MIIKSSFRRREGLESHLLRSDTNEAVFVRTDLFRGAADLHSALRLMDGIARSNPKTVRSFLHLVISPGHELSGAEFDDTLATIETEHGINPEAPRAIVQHRKGDRPDHFHAIYSVVDLVTGRAIKSNGNYERDELISRQLELRFGEKIIPGPRIAANIVTLRKRGLDQEADNLDLLDFERDGDALSRDDRQRATRTDANVSLVSHEIFALFEMAGADLAVFRRLAGEAGYTVCKGDAAALILDDKTGYHQSLVRCLRREAKAAGRPVIIRERDLTAAYPDLPDFAEARDAGLKHTQETANKAVDTEWAYAAFEAVADGEQAELEAFRTRQKKRRQEEEKKRKAEFQETLKARREAINETYSIRNEIRKFRIDRAFRIAKIFDTPAARRMAFGLAAAGILMTGGGLIMALAVGGVAANMLPTRARARRQAVSASRERTVDDAARRDELNRAFDRTKSECNSAAQQERFSFELIPKPDRILAGFYAVRLLQGNNEVEGNADNMNRVVAALGPTVVRGITRILERGSGLQVRRLTHWFAGAAPERRDEAVAAALRRHAAVKTEGTSHELEHGVGNHIGGQTLPAKNQTSPSGQNKSARFQEPKLSEKKAITSARPASKPRTGPIGQKGASGKPTGRAR